MWQCSYRSIVLVGLFFTAIVNADSQTATLSINANVINSCEAGASAGGSNVSFGLLDFGWHGSLDNPVSVVGGANSGAIRIKCNNNATYSIVMDAGQNSSDTSNRLLSDGNSLIPYNLYIDANHATVWNNTTGLSGTSNGQEAWIPVYGLVPAKSPKPTAGVYLDTVNVTLHY